MEIETVLMANKAKTLNYTIKTIEPKIIAFAYQCKLMRFVFIILCRFGLITYFWIFETERSVCVDVPDICWPKLIHTSRELSVKVITMSIDYVFFFFSLPTGGNGDGRKWGG